MKKIKRFTIVFFGLIISPFFTFCQDRYINIINGDVYRIEPDYSLSLITTIDYDLSIGDIAISPSGILYGVEMGGKILKIDFTDGSIEELNNFPENDTYTSLVCNSEYELYALSGINNLYKYSILTNVVEMVADIGESPPGDLSFYRGNLIFQSGSDGNIKAYNIETGELVTILCRAEPLTSNVGLWGISNSFDSCNSELIYATDNASHLYELDIENGAIYLLEYYDFLSFPQAYDINGMASDNEYLSSNCSYNFENKDCSVASNDFIISEDIKVYPNPADEFIKIENREDIKNVKIFSTDGRILKNINSFEDKISLAEIPSGIIIIKIYCSNSMIIKKIIKK